MSHVTTGRSPTRELFSRPEIPASASCYHRHLATWRMANDRSKRDQVKDGYVGGIFQFVDNPIIIFLDIFVNSLVPFSFGVYIRVCRFLQAGFRFVVAFVSFGRLLGSLQQMVIHSFRRFLRRTTGVFEIIVFSECVRDIVIIGRR